MHVETKSVTPYVAPVRKITIELTADEASKLRRVCYYNLTVQDKMASGVHGYPKAKAIKNFMSDLGNALKARGIDRF